MDKEKMRLGNQIDRLLKEGDRLEEKNDVLKKRNVRLEKDIATIRTLIELHIKDYELKGYEATTQRLKKMLRVIDENIGGHE